MGTARQSTCELCNVMSCYVMSPPHCCYLGGAHRGGLNRRRRKRGHRRRDSDHLSVQENKIRRTWRYVMLCYVMLCYVMLCYVMLCYAVPQQLRRLSVALRCHMHMLRWCLLNVAMVMMLADVMLCHVMSCHVMLCYLCHAVLCY